MDKIKKQAVSVYFANSTESEPGKNPGYYEVIKNPICLSRIQEKLSNGGYDSVIDWASDVRLVWFNAMTYYSPDHALNHIAKHLSKWFERKLQNHPRSVEEDWIFRFKKVHATVKELLAEAPLLNHPKPNPSTN